MLSETSVMPEPPTKAENRYRAARRIRWWLGSEAFDELLGARGAGDTAARALLSTHVAVTPATVQDGMDLLADRLDLHPRGLPVERWGTWLTRLRNVCLGVGVLGFLGVLVAGFALLGSSASEDPFEALSERVSPGTELFGAVLIGTSLSCGVLLIWVLSAWRHVIALAEARYAIRWAARRPGQATRGVPVADPFVGLGGVATTLAIIVWVLAAFALLFSLSLLLAGDGWPVIWFITLALGLLGWALLRGRRALREMAAVAGSHLLLLGHRDSGLRLDAATSVRSSFLLVTRDPSLFPRRSWSASEERVVYPLTADLPAHEVARRHDQVRQDDGNVSLVGDRGTAPLVTLEVPRSGQDNDPGHHLDTAPYAGGWVVARTKRGRRPAVIVVQDPPDRFRDEILPTFGDRHGLDLDAVEWHDPRPVPDSHDWLEDWAPPSA